jgi:pyruvate formate lyase activating enzyme
MERDLQLRIGGITDMSTVDWYGHLSMVVFWAGCNFRCPYCQNSGLIPLDSGTQVDLDFIRDRIEKALNPVETIETVVFTGGEPLLQPEEVIEAAKLFREYGLKIMLDTNGSIYNSFQRIVRKKLIDRVALDVKAPLNGEDYGRVVGLEDRGGNIVDAIKSVLKFCKEKNIPVEARTTVAPTVSDDPQFIRKIAEDILGSSTVYYLQQFDNQGEILDKRLKEMDPPPRSKMVELAEVARETGLERVYVKTRLYGLEGIP